MVMRRHCKDQLVLDTPLEQRLEISLYNMGLSISRKGFLKESSHQSISHPLCKLLLLLDSHLLTLCWLRQSVQGH